MPKLSKETRSLYSDDNEQWQSTDLHPSVKQQVKVQLERYVNADLAGDEEWTKASEIPTEREIGWIQDGEVISKDLHVPVAKIDEAYESKEEYLATQYKLMRADGTVPLAYCVDDFRRTGMRGESNDYRIYDEVCFSTFLGKSNHR